MKTKAKRNRLGRIALLLLFAAAACAVFYVLNQYKDRMVRAQVERLLPKLYDRFGLIVRYEELRSGPFAGLVLTNLAIDGQVDGLPIPLLQIDRIQIVPRIRFSPNFHLRISKINLTGPKMRAQLQESGKSNIPLAMLAAFSKGPGENGSEAFSGMLDRKSAGRVILSKSIQVTWEEAALTFVDGKYSRTERPVVIDLVEGIGKATLNLSDRTVKIEAEASLSQKKGKLFCKAEATTESVKLKVSAAQLRLLSFADYIPSLIVADENATLDGGFSTTLEKGQTLHTLHFDVGVKELCVDHWRLADHPIKGIDMEAAGIVDWDRKGKSFRFLKFDFGHGPAKISMTGSLDYADRLATDLKFFAQNLPVQAALDALPEDFVPNIHGAKVAGAMDIDLAVAFDTQNPRALKFEPDVRVKDYMLIRSPKGADLKKLKGEFVHTAKKKGVPVKTFTVGPSNPDFVPFEQLGHYTIRGVRTCEDGRFSDTTDSSSSTFANRSSQI